MTLNFLFAMTVFGGFMRWSLWIVMCGIAPAFVASAQPTQVTPTSTLEVSFAPNPKHRVHAIEVANTHAYRLSSLAVLVHNVSRFAALDKLSQMAVVEGKRQIGFAVPLKKGEAQLSATIAPISPGYWLLSLDAVIGDQNGEIDYREVAEAFRDSLRRRIERAPDAGHLIVVVPDFYDSRRSGWLVRPYEISKLDMLRDSLSNPARLVPDHKPNDVSVEFSKALRLAYGVTMRVHLPFASVGAIAADITRTRPDLWVVSLDRPRFETPNAGYRDQVMSRLLGELQTLAEESEYKGQPVHITMPHWADVGTSYVITSKETIAQRPTTLGFGSWIKVQPNRDHFAPKDAAQFALGGTPKTEPLTLVLPLDEGKFWIAHGQAYVASPPVMRGGDVVRPSVVRILVDKHSVTDRGPGGESKLRPTELGEIPHIIARLKKRHDSPSDYQVVMRVPISEHRHYLLSHGESIRTTPIALPETDPSLWENHRLESHGLPSEKTVSAGHAHTHPLWVRRKIEKRQRKKAPTPEDDEPDVSLTNGESESTLR